MASFTDMSSLSVFISMGGHIDSGFYTALLTIGIMCLRFHRVSERANLLLSGKMSI